MRTVYCDSGAYRKELRQLEARGLIAVTAYAYENSTAKIKARAPGSNPSWDEGDSTWRDEKGSWDDEAVVSDRWVQILELLGPNSLKDAKHLDSACLGKCDIFLTSDKRDIANRAAQIHALTGIRVFHSTSDWESFMVFVEDTGSGDAA